MNSLIYNKMNVLFLTMAKISSLNNGGIYEDLMREFVKNGHHIYIVSPTEKRDKQKTHIQESGDNYSILRVKTGNLQKTDFVRKGIATLRVESQFKKAIKKVFKNVRFDLIIYSTPPITLFGAVKYYKKKYGAKTFLLLKDIFPQNAVDIGILKTSGLKGIIYSYFRSKERKLYSISDCIGCMSQANKNYIIAHNPKVEDDRVTIVPNSIEPVYASLSAQESAALRAKYGVPVDKTVFVYGGNLGKPQNVPFIIECLKSQACNDDAFFLIVGDGTDYGKFEEFVKNEAQPNVKVLRRLERNDFETLLAACDIGMIFLDYRFSIPNYPSRLLSYMQAGLPVLACTDPNTDVGKDIVDNGFGWWCVSDNVENFNKTIQNVFESNLEAMSQKSLDFLRENFTVEISYEKIMTTLYGDKL